LFFSELDYYYKELCKSEPLVKSLMGQLAKVFLACGAHPQTDAIQVKECLLTITAIYEDQEDMVGALLQP
jgi:hypothetical protein